MVQNEIKMVKNLKTAAKMLIHEVGSLCCASNAEEVWHNIRRSIKGLLQCMYTHHDNFSNNLHKLGRTYSVVMHMYYYCTW